MSMTSRQRLVTAIEGGIPDRLPATTHHVMPYFLETYLDGIDYLRFFDRFGLDPVQWVVEHKPNEKNGEYYDPLQEEPGFLQPRWICSDNWRIRSESIPDQQYHTVRYSFITPGKTLSMVIQSDKHTSWVTERLVKEKSDIDIIADYTPAPLCDVEEVNRQAEEFGEQGLVRGMIPGFDVYGQPGCWQDAAVLFGIQNLIMATFDDPSWVHAFLQILEKRKAEYIQSMEGAQYDILELGGGDASSTVISPEILEEFVVPYDRRLTELAHKSEQRIVYHTCGGMMAFLETLVGIGAEALETFTPPSMGGDTRLSEAKNRVGDQVAMIGGFDQFHYFQGCSPEETRDAVRRCFEAAGEGGGYILSPSDHFFDAEPELIAAYAEEARNCKYQ